MLAIRIPDEQWGKVWRALVASGPISCVSPERVYLISERQVRMLRRRKLPFVCIDNPSFRREGPGIVRT